MTSVKLNILEIYLFSKKQFGTSEIHTWLIKGSSIHSTNLISNRDEDFPN